MVNNNAVKVEALIQQDINTVWDFWTNSKHIIRWNQASDDWHTTRVEIDFRPGGNFLYRMEAKDGSFGFDFSGTYNNIITNRIISYVLGDGRKVTNIFEIIGGNTKVTQLFEPEKENSAEVQRAGWQSVLNNFKKYVEDYQSI
ncbi:MAG: polyketide cyclase [Ignavibacteriae bacterium HGW-Ignavibacteriae-3]|nr:MAG: polyketide cyclase [Ignavibacteriae bacterium HGW-Ignavibacteriae-3]